MKFLCLSIDMLSGITFLIPASNRNITAGGAKGNHFCMLRLYAVNEK
jgi:hypothetical protein